MKLRALFAILGSLTAMAMPFAVLAAPVCSSLLDHRLVSIKGAAVDLCGYMGKVVLIVNTASYCGYTEQYKGLQAIHDRFRERGFTVIGFPANDFGKQEPGSNQEVADFCERTYKVAFPLMEKTRVIGDGVHSLYARLSRETADPPRWNFHKYLIGRDGMVIRSFASKVTPESAELTGAIEMALNRK